MRLYPAIDLRDGRCVRLYQGDYDQQTTYGNDPAEQAEAFAAEGATWIHVVDLDAALTGQPTNRAVIGRICSRVEIPVEVGGGVRDRAAAEELFNLGVARVVIGTAALENPQLVADLVDDGRSVAVGLDARGDEVATHGWTHPSGRTVAELADRFARIGVEALIVTEISRDGTLEGPDIEGLSELLAATDLPLIASGGVGSLDDLSTLAAITAPVPVDQPPGTEPKRLEGVIVGRALYEKTFTVSEALTACGSRESEVG